MKNIIIIPTYNEKDNIVKIIEAVFNIAPEIFILVVDDNSPDGTADVVKNLSKKFPNLGLFVREKKEGLGKAYIDAFLKVLKDRDIDKIIMMDADFSHDPKYLRAMIEAGKNFDVVLGSRYVKGGGTDGWALWRRLLSRWGNFYARIITRLPVADCTAGFYLIDADILRKIDFSKVDASGYAFNIELKYFLQKSGARFKEIPMVLKNRVEGESKISHHFIYEGIVAPWKMIFKKIDIEHQCFICGNGTADFWVKKQGCNLYRCRACGLIFVYPLPENLEKLYGKDYFEGAKEGFGYVNYEEDKNSTSSVFEKYLDKIEKIMPQKGKLFDIGAATGNFLEAAIRRGWQASGVEISDYAAAKARQKGLDVQTETFLNLKSQKNYFDVITMWDVLEHLENPEKKFHLIFDSLKPGGIIVINTPDAGSFFARLMGRRWHLLLPPEHLFYFNRDNLTTFFEKNGFEICLMASIGKKFTMQYIFHTLARWQKFFLWRSIAEKIPNTLLGRLTVPVNLRDNMFIIARKIK